VGVVDEFFRSLDDGAALVSPLEDEPRTRGFSATLVR
jgi:hypothetical protein